MYTYNIPLTNMLFKKAVKNVGKFGSDLFGKGKIGGEKLFGKGSLASRGLGAVSRGASRAGQALENSAGALGAIAGNPALQGLAAASGVGEGALLAAGAASGLGGLAGGLLKAGGDATHQRNYHGNADQVTTQIANNVRNLQQPIGDVKRRAGLSTSSEPPMAFAYPV